MVSAKTYEISKFTCLKLLGKGVMGRRGLMDITQTLRHSRRQCIERVMNVRDFIACEMHEPMTLAAP